MRQTHPPRGRTLALGWAAVVAMWVLAYLAFMQPGRIAGEALFGLMLLCPVVAGYLAGRDERLVSGGAPGDASGGGARSSPPPGAAIRSIIAGAKVGLVIALVNLLIVGSLLMDPETHRFRAQAIWWVLGNLVVTTGLAKLGAALAAAPAPGAPPAAETTRSPGHWFSLFTRVAAVAVFLLLITGGLVTGLRAGLAVPDWPTSFGHNMLLYPLAGMIGGPPGVYYEHAHRLYGMLVGLTAITLAAQSFVLDSRWRLRLLTIAVLVMVCVQGYLGGRRVTQTSTALAIIHGVFAQVVFATTVAVATMTSATWRVAPQPARPSQALQTDRTATVIVLGLVLLQVVVGALYRHLRRQADEPGAAMHHLIAHVVVALLVAGAVIFAAGRAWSRRADQPILRRLGQAMIHALLAQLALGIIAVVLVLQGRDSQAGRVEIALTTAHQAVGATLLALATLLAMWTRRLPIGTTDAHG